MTDGLTILVVDDSATMRAILGAILCAGGHDIVFAENVDIALRAFRLRRPDLVLTDYTMPNRTGLDLVLDLRRGGFDGPVLVISSESDSEIHAAMRRAGADGWLSKPVHAAALIQTVETVRTTRPDPAQLPAEPEAPHAARYG